MSVGKKILQMRLQHRKSQRELGESTGLAVSYLSRLENGRITPTVKTLAKIATAFRVPVSAFFDSAPVLEAPDHCPVSLSGSCILDQLYVGRGKKPRRDGEAYSPQQLAALKLCNFLLQTRDKELVRALVTMLNAEREKASQIARRCKAEKVVCLFGTAAEKYSGKIVGKLRPRQSG